MRIITDIDKALEHLRSGGLVAIPTETVYGLAGVASNEEAIRKIFEVKKRPFFDPLIVHISDRNQVETIAEALTIPERVLVDAFWPGPLTLVKKKLPGLNPLITSGHEKVAIRVPKHELTLTLLERLGEPIVAPSANQFGRTSPTTAQHVAQEFQPEDDVLILEGGPCSVGIESTVLEVEEVVAKILRPGGISAEEITEKLEAFNIGVVHESSSQSPGHLKHHYQPKVSFIVVEEDIDLTDLVKLYGTDKIKEFTLSFDPNIAARTLYAMLRGYDDGEADLLVLRWSFPKTGLWSAIWDRVQRAQKLR